MVLRGTQGDLATGNNVDTVILAPRRRRVSILFSLTGANGAAVCFLPSTNGGNSGVQLTTQNPVQFVRRADVGDIIDQAVTVRATAGQSHISWIECWEEGD